MAELFSGHTSPIVEPDGAGGHKPYVVISGSGTAAAINLAAPNLASGQVSVAATATQIVASRATRRTVAIKNLDTLTTIYIGPATVTVANGMELKAGESISVDATVAIQGIAASGTVTAAYLESYD